MALSAVLLLVAAATEVATQGGVQPAWTGHTARDLHREYHNIFRHGNRNAASHLWSAFLLERAHGMSRETFEHLSASYCAVSGSPVTPNDYNRYLLRLPRADGSGVRVPGFMQYCCWPCVCDTQDFIRVDTKNVTTLEGTRSYNFAVIGNPCSDREALARPFQDRFSRGTLAQVAPEVRCDGDTLIGAPKSDGGHVVIGLFFDVPGTAPHPAGGPQPGRVTSDGGMSYQDEDEYAQMCEDRKNAGYNSGMGEIFRRVAGITPLSAGCDTPSPTCPAGNPALDATPELSV